MTTQSIVSYHGMSAPMILSYDDTAIGERPVMNGMTHGRSRLASDPVGSIVLTLTNIAVGSRYRIERQVGGSTATPTGNAEGVAAAGTVAITLDRFAPGSANNDLRIKVRKASAAPLYKPFESLTTLSGSAQSVYVAQVQDA